MSGISPVNIQHIVQMGTATEKVQHNLQNLPHANGQHQNEERKISDELKRLSVQNSELSNQSNNVDPDGSGANQFRKKNKKPDLDSEDEAYKRKMSALEENQGGTINVMI
ncbi:MAG: hypothetical protein O3A78_00715 [Nitrospinae bacterium]|jgi:hypothetical protein|nr:hypothetical protein [Nitrospinota bacterium]MDA1108329.1 hypothetical protein [Nitrospinota bacterium]